VDGPYGAFIVEDPPLPEGATERCFPPDSDSSSPRKCVPADSPELNVVLSDWWIKDSRTQQAGLARVKFQWIGDPQVSSKECSYRKHAFAPRSDVHVIH
jgi:hypothetical protein